MVSVASAVKRGCRAALAMTSRASWPVTRGSKLVSFAWFAYFEVEIVARQRRWAEPTLPLTPGIGPRQLPNLSLSHCLVLPSGGLA